MSNQFGVGDLFSPDGRTVMPRRFTATGNPDDDRYELRMEVEVDQAGEPTCRRLELEALGDDPVTGELLRRIPVARYMRERLAAIASGWVIDSRTPDGDLLIVNPDTDERIAIHRRVAKVARKPRKGAAMSDEHLKEVAEVYREALVAGRSTSAAICDKWFVAPPTASKYVRRARDRGFLGPAKPGKASA